MRGGGVQGPFDPKRNVPAVDLGTVREVLGFIRDDLQRVPGLERAAELLSSALAEVDTAARRRLAPVSGSIMDARQLRRRRH